MENKFKKYHEAVKYLENLPSINNGCFLPGTVENPRIYLERTKFFLNLIGNPQDELEFVHVTGTSGKGSVCAFLANMLSASGKKTDFSSPYVTTSIEKASIDGEYISPEEFAKIVEFFKPKIDEANEKCPFGRPTYFEIFFAISLFYFAKEKCNIVVLEVGCGGRYDATNIIKNPKVAIITNINLDHTHIIGDTLEKIAYEKAGIIKRDSAFFTNEKNEKLLEIFREECEKVGAVKKSVENVVSGQKYVDGILSLDFDGMEVRSKLWGNHQIENINIAISVARYLEIKNENIKKGIEKTNIPCRFELMQRNPLVVLDGAHNPSKMESTAENVKKMDFEKLILVVGISQTKDAENFLEKIVPLADRVISTNISFGKPLEPERILEISLGFSKKDAVLEVEPDYWSALEKALHVAGENDLVLVAGSFYLSGELRRKWFLEEYVLEKKSSF